MRAISERFSTPALPLADAPSRLGQLATLHWGLLASALALTVIGLLTVRSAAAELGAGYMNRQLIWVAAGFLATLVAFGIDYHRPCCARCQRPSVCAS